MTHTLLSLHAAYDIMWIGFYIHTLYILQYTKVTNCVNVTCLLWLEGASFEGRGEGDTQNDTKIHISDKLYNIIIVMSYPVGVLSTCHM